ncbi:Conserved_hypothetical protein [Hexamita inflata]|uniref:Uncharacterized protein n=1 Tax=Hexamita inflata TaxID=28002 RepID=A0AA86UW15_9EUKA|nr:Conserved hypothetical protein [Hexamita inflata]
MLQTLLTIISDHSNRAFQLQNYANLFYSSKLQKQTYSSKYLLAVQQVQRKQTVFPCSLNGPNDTVCIKYNQACANATITVCTEKEPICQNISCAMQAFNPTQLLDNTSNPAKVQAANTTDADTKCKAAINTILPNQNAVFTSSAFLMTLGNGTTVYTCYVKLCLQQNVDCSQFKCLKQEEQLVLVCQNTTCNETEIRENCIARCNDANPYFNVYECLNGCPSYIINATYPFLFDCVPSCSKFYVVDAKSQQQCVDSCPSDKPYMNGQECMASCPANAPYAEANKTCTDKCASGAYQVLVQAQALVCMASCSGFYVTNLTNSNSKQCVTNCPSSNPFMFGKECLIQCPSDNPFAEANKTCVSRCASGQYNVVTGQSQTLICTDICGLFVYNTSNGNSKLCYTGCPASTPYIYNNQCLAVCPNGQPYAETTKICTALCSTGAYYVDTTGAQQLFCQTSCSGLYVVNTSNSNSKQCVTVCPNDKLFQNGNQCVNQCPAGSIYFVNNICYAKCPDPTPYAEANNSCVARCASGNYSIVTGQTQQLICQGTCLNFYVINTTNSNSKQCVVSCPASQQYAEANKTCTDSCASFYYTYNSTLTQKYYCVAPCTGLFITNTTNTNFKQCVDSCPAGNIYMYQNACLTNCPSNAPYAELNNSCTVRCASGAYQVVVAVQTHNCMNSCTVYYVVNASNSNSQQCVTSCVSPNIYLYNSQCVPACLADKPYIYNNICKASCPSDKPYAESTKVCTALCSTNAYIIVVDVQTLQCQPSCPNYYITNTSNSNSKNCQTNCPSTAPYAEANFSCVSTCSSLTYNITALSTPLQCVSSCTQFYVTNGTQKYCVPDCNGSYPVYVTGTSECIGSCPGSYPLIVVNRCQAVCSSKAYCTKAKMFGNNVQLYCQDDEFSVSQKGISNCVEFSAITVPQQVSSSIFMNQKQIFKSNFIITVTQAQVLQQLYFTAQQQTIDLTECNISFQVQTQGLKVAGITDFTYNIQVRAVTLVFYARATVSTVFQGVYQTFIIQRSNITANLSQLGNTPCGIIQTVDSLQTQKLDNTTITANIEAKLSTAGTIGISKQLLTLVFTRLSLSGQIVANTYGVIVGQTVASSSVTITSCTISINGQNCGIGC